jgi:hypothetical protein
LYRGKVAQARGSARGRSEGSLRSMFLCEHLYVYHFQLAHPVKLGFAGTLALQK